MTSEAPVSWYLGANVGVGQADLSTRPPTGVTFSSVSTDETDIGYKIFGGFRFHRHFAVEVGYTNLGRYTLNATTVPAGSVHASFKNDGWNLDLVPIIEFGRAFSLFGRVGAYYSDSKLSTTASGPLIGSSRSESDWSWKTGVGLQYDFTREMGVRAEFERFNRLGPTNQRVDLFSIGLIFLFRS